LILVIQGFFFAGSPTAGEGMTAQRFMAAKSERHAIGGQLFNAFLALTVRTLPLIGLGLVALSLFWTSELADKTGPAPAGMTTISDPAYAWAELVKRCTLPAGLVGLLIATEVAAYMSTLSALINWGTSFVVNDLYDASKRGGSKRSEIWISRIATLALFAAAAAIAIAFVEGMIGWFMFINSAMVIFLLPLAWFRFFWWRFNVWGELAAIVLGLPLSIVVWFVLGFQDRPAWQGLGLLLVMSFVVLTAVTLLTPPEPKEVLRGFYQRCRPPGFWGPVCDRTSAVANGEPSTAKLMVDSSLGILSCLGLVLATNAFFVKNWTVLIAGLIVCAVFGAWLLTRVFDRPALGGRASCPPLTSTASGAQASCPPLTGRDARPQECGIDPSTGG
jgi:Na+/proline symporter